MKVPAKKRCLGADEISFKNDLSFIINANNAMQNATKKAKADAATGEFRCFPKEAFIAAKIGIPIPAKSMIVANDSILPPAVILVFFFIIFLQTFLLNDKFELLGIYLNAFFIYPIHQQILHFLEYTETGVLAFSP